MNKKAILAVAKVIEHFDRLDMGAWAKRADDLYKDATITDLWERCDTAGCIAGWTAAWADRSPGVERRTWSEIGAEELGLTHREGCRLFLDYDEFYQRPEVRAIAPKGFDMTAAEAAALLRAIAKGKVTL